MAYMIKIIGNFAEPNRPEHGKYLKEFHPDSDPMGLGDLIVTTDRNQAMQFATTERALAFWRQQSKLVPYRPDGKPNRPLTAYTVEIASDE